MSKEEKPNSEQLVEFTPVKDTPFTIGKQDGKFYLLLGQYRLTEGLNTMEEAITQTALTWDNVTKVILVLIDKFKQK